MRNAKREAEVPRTGSQHLPNLCPLCDSDQTTLLHTDQHREYERCHRCGLVFVPRRYFLSSLAERACYDHHNNDPGDANYRRFLGRLFHPLVKRLEPGAQGLDFGSGPGPTLSLMFIEAGFQAVIYDPYYAPHGAVWNDVYDYVTATEVVEHLHQPMAELQRIWSVIKPGGWLGIMTKRVPALSKFADWHYTKDPTHVTFFAEETFAWLANRWSAELQIVGTDAVLLQKAP